MISQQELQARLDQAAADFHLPGAAIALIQGGKTLTAVTGTTNATTRSPVVLETLFAAGSVTKVFTASLIMTYVDEGLVAAMQTPQAEMPWGLGYDQMGLGWTIRKSGGHTMVSHTGANAGAHSSLALVPDQQGAVAVLTNGTTGAAVHAKLTTEILRESFGVEPAVPAKTPATPVEVNLERYTGVFIADDGQVTFTIENGRLRLAPVAAPGLLRSFYLMGLPAPTPDFLTPVSADGRFVADRGLPVWFIDDGTGRPKYVYVGRIYRREAGGAG